MRSASKHYKAWLAAGAATLAVPPLQAMADKGEPRGPLFDPEALERGAAALREINKSPHAKQVRARVTWCPRSRRACMHRNLTRRCGGCPTSPCCRAGH
jgi:hypothetical protein